MAFEQKHIKCVSYLRDYGGFYRLTVCKCIFDDIGSFSDDEILCMKNEFGVDARVAKKLLTLKYYNHMAYLRYVEHLRLNVDVANIENDIDLETKKMGRFLNNIVRAKSTIQQLGACNPWEYFVTFTIDPQKFDRYDFSVFYKSFSKFVNNYKRKTGIKFSYVFVPEQHHDGAWHLHGLINGLPLEHLRLFTLDEKLPYYIRNKLHDGQCVYDWTAFSEKFGYTIVEPIRNAATAASYITKYVAKGFGNDERFKNAKLFIPSLGLKRAELIKTGHTDMRSVQPIFENDYTIVYNFPKSDNNVTDIEKYFL